MDTPSLTAKTTHSIVEMKELYRLQYRTYCLEKQYLPPSDYPEESESDELDAYSFQASLWDDSQVPGRLLGCVRLIPPNPLGLPCVNTFPITEAAGSQERAAEISRFIVSSETRSSERMKVFKILCGMTYRLLVTQGIRTCYTVTDERFYRLLCRMGFPYRQLGPAQPFMGEPFHAWSSRRPLHRYPGYRITGSTAPYNPDSACTLHTAGLSSPTLHSFGTNGALFQAHFSVNNSST